MAFSMTLLSSSAASFECHQPRSPLGFVIQAFCSSSQIPQPSHLLHFLFHRRPERDGRPIFHRRQLLRLQGGFNGLLHGKGSIRIGRHIIFPQEAVDANGVIVETDWVNEKGEPVVILPFSTDLSAAFQIVYKLRQDGWTMSLNQSGDSYTCRFSRRLEFGTEMFQVEPSFPKTFTAAEAITKCALLVALSQPRKTAQAIG